VLVARVLRTIEEHRLLSAHHRVLVAVSGGPDSTALLHALVALRARLGIELEVATVDHGLRAGSALEHAAVRTYVESIGLRCEVITLTLARGPAAQARAREARYAALAALATERGLDAIAVGHTLDDQAETVLQRLLRGAGVRGLAGALRRREDGVIRPLLDCGRAEVEGFLRARGVVPLVEDPSNRSEGFLRARVRHRHLPALAEEQPEIRGMLARLADDAEEHRALVESLAGAVVGSPEIASLSAAAPPVRRERLRRWAEAVGAGALGRAHLEALERALLTARGEIRLPRGLLASIEEGRLVARSRASPTLRTGEPPPEESGASPEGSGGSGESNPPVEEA
jgi:tRNA(Ile)-lysidine synthase